MRAIVVAAVAALRTMQVAEAAAEAVVVGVVAAVNLSLNQF
jgi:hypothetical protein